MKLSVGVRKNTRMDEVIKNIFYSAVNAVKPSELITRNNLMKVYNVNSREIIEFNCGKQAKKFDVTGKRIHLGES